MHLDRPPHLSQFVALTACAGEPPARVGRKAAVLGWAASNGLATPGGVVVPAERFWAAVDAAGAAGQARYLEQAAFRLDPRHALDIAASIVEAMRCPAVEELAARDADGVFAELAPPPLVCRSSSAMEDGHTAAFSGVFASVLDLGTPAALAGAIATCWRSAFSPTAVRYLLRMGPEPADFSLAVLLQRQVAAAWYGVYASADPITGAPEPCADLTDAGPEAVVGGEAARVRAVRCEGRWTGVGKVPALRSSLLAVERAAAQLGRHLGAEVDLEFALPQAGGPPVILQCRPLTAAGGPVGSAPLTGGAGGRRLYGRPCAGGRASGVATDGGGGDGSGIAVVGQLTTADYAVVLGHAGVVSEQDASPLSHVAILCRELGVPFVCGVDEARDRLVGRWVVVDGRSGVAEIVEQADGAASAEPQPPSEPVLTALELDLRLLAEGRPGADPVTEARRILRRYGQALGSERVQLTVHPLAPADQDRLDRLGAELFGLGFSALDVVAPGPE